MLLLYTLLSSISYVARECSSVRVRVGTGLLLWRLLLWRFIRGTRLLECVRASRDMLLALNGYAVASRLHLGEFSQMSRDIPFTRPRRGLYVAAFSPRVSRLSIRYGRRAHWAGTKKDRLITV